MLGAFVHERVAAGRDVPAEVWTVIDKYPPAEEIAAIEARAATARSTIAARPRSARLSHRIQELSMRIFDPHAHMTSRTTDDYEAMAASGVKVLVEPAFWLGQPRTSVGSFIDYFNSLLGWERFRAGAVRHPPSLHDRPEPEGGQRRRAAPRGDRHPAALPGQGRRRRGRRDRLRRDDAGRGARRCARSSRSRVEHELPVLVHTPHRDKARGHAQDDRARRGVGHRARDGA